MSSELILSEPVFHSVLARERKRADRSNLAVVLVLVALDRALGEGDPAAWTHAMDALAASKRQTDVLGWFKTHDAIGLIVPDIAGSVDETARALDSRVRAALSRRVPPQVSRAMPVRLYVYAPTGSTSEEADPLADSEATSAARSGYSAIKRVLDVVLGLALVVMLSPLLAAIAALVKFMSPGPILLCQERVGHRLKPFVMLKFRTMRVDADHAIHQQFVSSFIKFSGGTAGEPETAFFKIRNDPRVTAIGRVLRRTSLDELPQLWNVVRGEMSLVGPRPPLPYEVQCYKPWHLRRLVEAKPGVTGLWQVTGRSRTTFDEMVRLDIRYARTHSVWTDLRILLATPRAVITGKGAC